MAAEVQSVYSRFPWFGKDCSPPAYSEQCHLGEPSLTSAFQGSMAQSRWLRGHGDPGREVAVSMATTGELSTADLVEMKQEFSNNVLNGWDPTPQQLFEYLQSNKMKPFDFRFVWYARNMIMAEVCLARDPWCPFYSALKCLSLQELRELIEYELDPDVKYYEEVKRLASEDFVKEFIRQLDLELGLRNEFYVAQMSSLLMKRGKSEKDSISIQMKCLENKRQALLEKLHKQYELNALLDYNIVRTHEATATRNWTFNRKASVANRVKQAENKIWEFLEARRRRAERLACFISDVVKTTRTMLMILTGSHLTEAEATMKLVNECIKEPEPTYCPSSGQCILPKFLAPSPGPSVTLKTAVTAKGDQIPEDVEEEWLEEEQGARKRVRCGPPRHRGGACSPEVQQILNLQSVEVPKMPVKGKFVETVNAGPPPGHPNTASSCLWYILSPIATPFLHFFQRDPYCANYQGHDDEDDTTDDDDGRSDDKDEGSIVDRCSGNFFSRQWADSWKKKEPEKPTALKDLPLWTCLCSVFGQTLGPYFNKAYSKMDNFFYCSQEDDQDQEDTCATMARKQPLPRRVCAEEAAAKSSGEVNFKFATCNLSRMAQAIQVHLYNLSFTTGNVCPTSDSPFFMELRMMGSPAAELPPKALAQAVQNQLVDFVTILDNILNVSEGKSVPAKSSADDFSISSSGDTFMSAEEKRERRIRNAVLLRDYS